MLENEVVAKTALAEEVQRLKDELRGTNTDEDRLITGHYYYCRSRQEMITKSVEVAHGYLLRFFLVIYRHKRGACSYEVEPGNIEYLDS